LGWEFEGKLYPIPVLKGKYEPTRSSSGHALFWIVIHSKEISSEGAGR
jgi:hypothetical protein